MPFDPIPSPFGTRNPTIPGILPLPTPFASPAEECKKQGRFAELPRILRNSAEENGRRGAAELVQADAAAAATPVLFSHEQADEAEGEAEDEQHDEHHPAARRNVALHPRRAGRLTERA